MKHIFQKNLQFRDIWPRNRQKFAQSEVLGHFLDFPSLVFPDFAHNDRWAWCLIVFLQFAGPDNVFLFSNMILGALKACEYGILKSFLIKFILTEKATFQGKDIFYEIIIQNNSNIEKF